MTNASNVRLCRFATISCCVMAIGCTDPDALVDAAEPSDGGTLADGMSADAAAPARASLRVLFIGDSLTYVNDVPGMLSRIASTAGTGPSIATESVVQGGALLFQHWQNGFAQKRIAEGTWTHVVLQDQSVEPAVLPQDLVTDARPFAQIIAAAGARATWYVTWAHSAGDALYDSQQLFADPEQMQDRLSYAYAAAARANPGSLLACVGEAFRSSMRAHPEIALVDPDHTHATLAGSYLAACTFYVALTGAAVPSSADVPAGIDPAVALVLRQEANVGSACADAHVKGQVTLKGTPFELASDQHDADGGVTNPLDCGAAAVPVPVLLIFRNAGPDLAATITGASITGPFKWTNGAYPGATAIDGLAPDGGTPSPFCGSTVDAGTSCLLSVSYTGESSGTGAVTLDVADAYQVKATRTLVGTAAPKDRALLTLSASPLWVTVQSAFGTPSVKFTDPSAPVGFVLSNRGGVPTTAITEGASLPSPLVWGVPGGAGFPGGTGVGSPPLIYGLGRDAVRFGFPYCDEVLQPGAQCLLGVSYSQPAKLTSAVIDVAYADAVGPVATHASASVPVILPAPNDGGSN